MFGRAFSTLAAALIAAPVAGQTVAEAAAANVQLAITLCIQNSHDGPQMLQAFNAAGFAYTPEDFGGGHVLHWYGAPEGTAVTAIVIDPGRVTCRIDTPHFGVSQAIPFARAVFQTLYNGPIWDGSPEGARILPGTPAGAQDMCSGFHIIEPQFIWFQFGTGGQDPVCVDNGTSQISSGM